MKELIAGNAFFWRVATRDSYAKEIHRAVDKGFQIGQYIGEKARGTWVLSGEELLKYIEIRSAEFKVIKKR